MIDSSWVRTEHPGRPLLDHREPDTRLQECVRGRLGLPFADGDPHSSRFPTATSTRPTAVPMCRRASSADVQNMGR